MKKYVLELMYHQINMQW